MSNHRTVTRRSVLKASAAALAFPYFVPDSALGKGSRAAPGNRIALGMIGVGNMGGAHLNYFLNHSEAQIIAICDVNGEKRESAKSQVDERYTASSSGFAAGCHTYNDFEDLLARDDIDAVCIAVPDHWHAIIAIAACRAGKDVYCEKPLSLTIHEAWEMVRAARRYGTVFQTGSQQRSSDNFRFACELVRNGCIGKLLRINVSIGEPSKEAYLPEEPIPAGFDWQRWLGPAPWQPYSNERSSGNYSGGWRMIRDYSGGMTTDWGAHHFDIAQWGMGRDGSGPIEIHPPSGKARENLRFVYDDGVEMVRGGANGVLFTGTDGKVEVNRGHLQTWPDQLKNQRIGPNDIHLYESPGQQQDWFNCIRTRSRPICDVEIGASSATVCHLGNIAYWLNRSIKWDPKRRTIIDDPNAARWIDRPKRAPWRLYV